jgi:hypothetical protein
LLLFVVLILHAGKLFIYLSAPDSWGGISYTLPPLPDRCRRLW